MRYWYLQQRKQDQLITDAEALELLALDHVLRNESNAMVTGFVALVGVSLLGHCPPQAVLVGAIVTLVSWALNRRIRGSH